MLHCAKLYCAGILLEIPSFCIHFVWYISKWPFSLFHIRFQWKFRYANLEFNKVNWLWMNWIESKWTQTTDRITSKLYSEMENKCSLALPILAHICKTNNQSRRSNFVGVSVPAAKQKRETTKKSHYLPWINNIPSENPHSHDTLTYAYAYTRTRSLRF